MFRTIASLVWQKDNTKKEGKNKHFRFILFRAGGAFAPLGETA